MRVLFGHPGVRGSDATHLNTPDDAYMLPDGSFTVADAYNCRVLSIRGRPHREAAMAAPACAATTRRDCSALSTATRRCREAG